MLSQKSITIIKSTVPLLEKYGVEITSTFYKNMFATHPQLLNIFNHSNQRNMKQPIALANTILQSAIHIERLNEINLMPIVHKHVALGIMPEHYPIVGGLLIGAMKIVMGDEATPEIITAWTEAYRCVAQAFMDAEEDLYYETEEQTGGWKGIRDFVVDRIVEETPLIKSFYFKSLDGKEIASYIPGQYITVKVPLAGDGVDVPVDKERTYVRHYSLSDQPNEEYYRISIKKQVGNGRPNGIVSNHFYDNIKIGDVIPMSVPCGDFVVDLNEENPILLISGGVGINPLLAMAKETLLQQPNRKINFIFSTNNETTHPFKEEIKQMEEESAENGGNFKVNIIYTDVEGHITKELIEKYTNPSDQAEMDGTDVYICGPVKFMVDVNKCLLEIGYQKEAVHYELFGPLTPVLEENQMLKSVREKY